MGIGSLSIQGIGCADELLTIINDLRAKKPISTVYIAQFGAQLFFLAFSAKNFQLTENLTEVSGSRNPKSIRKILRQHNSNGSFKYLFAAADVMEKNIEAGLAKPMMLRIIYESSLNVVDKVKNECKKAFNSRISCMLIMIESETSTSSFLKSLLKHMNFKSLEKLMNFTQKFICKSSQTYREKKMENLPFDYYLKTVYMAIYNRNENENINVSISSLTEDSFDDLANEIISDFVLNGKDLSREFDNKFNDLTDIDLGRKIYLIINARCEEFVDDLKNYSKSWEVSEEDLYEAIENVLKRLSIEAATLFFGLVKSILNECILQMPMPEAIRKCFQMLIRNFNGDLTAIEKKLKMYIWNNNKENGNKFEKDFIDELFPKEVLELKACSVCGGQGFV